MAVKIRCQKTGANNDPCFRIVATDIRAPRDGKSLETLGWYDPKKPDKNFFLRLDRIEAWRQKGAQISDIVKSLMKQAKTGAMAAPQTTAVPTPVSTTAPAVPQATPAAQSTASEA